MLWKTSCNTDFVFLCLAAALAASSSFPLHSHKKGSGLLGFMAIEQGGCQSSTAGQTPQSVKPLHQPGALNAGGACSKQLTNTELGEPGAAARCWSTFLAALTVGLNCQRASPPEQCAKHEHGLRDFCFFLPCRMDLETYHTPVKCMVPFLMNKALPKHLLLWLPMSKNLLFDFLSLPALSLMHQSHMEKKKTQNNIAHRVMRCKTAVNARRSVRTKHSHILAKIAPFSPSTFILRNVDFSEHLCVHHNSQI